MISEKQIHKIGRIDQVIRDFFEANPSIIEIPAKELMPVFIQKGIFYKNNRDGLPIQKNRTYPKGYDIEQLGPGNLVKHF